MLGSGSIVVLWTRTLRGAGGVADHEVLPRESCGQCTPCREGPGWLERIMDRIETGRTRGGPRPLTGRLRQHRAGLAWPPQQTTICVLGPSIPSSIVSAIRMFRDEFLVHVKEGRCPYD